MLKILGWDGGENDCRERCKVRLRLTQVLRTGALWCVQHAVKYVVSNAAQESRSVGRSVVRAKKINKHMRDRVTERIERLCTPRGVINTTARRYPQARVVSLRSNASRKRTWRGCRTRALTFTASRPTGSETIWTVHVVASFRAFAVYHYSFTFVLPNGGVPLRLRLFSSAFGLTVFVRRVRVEIASSCQSSHEAFTSWRWWEYRRIWIWVFVAESFI